MHQNEFGQVDHATITILVENRADLIVKSSETVRRFGGGPLLAMPGVLESPFMRIELV
jgi:hypothetical protein